MPDTKTLRRILTEFALSLDKAGKSDGTTLLSVVTPKGRISHSLNVNVRIVHNSFSPKVFGAIFSFPDYRFRFKGKRRIVDFLMVCPQLRPKVAVGESSILINSVSPVSDIPTYAEFEEAFVESILYEWND